jgi:hypothetical protein
MVLERSRNRNLKVGDLVTHVLYGKEWIGMIVLFEEEKENSSLFHQKALVQIQPGTKYDGFFDKKTTANNRVTGNLGYISVNWLFKLELKKRC